MIFKKYKKDAISWAFYDWANSAFATTVMAGFFPIFYKSYWASDLSNLESTAMARSSLRWFNLKVNGSKFALSASSFIMDSFAKTLPYAPNVRSADVRKGKS